MFEINQDVNLVDSYTNATEFATVTKVTKTKVTVMGWDFEAEFARKADSFWNGDFYLEVA